MHEQTFISSESKADKTLKNMLNEQIGKNNSSLITAFKFLRICSNLSFLRQCRRDNIIPRGFRVQNKIKDTTSFSSQSACKLMLKQSREWMQLAIEDNYKKLNSLKSAAFFPLSKNEYSLYCRYSFFLRCVKRKKLRHLRSEKNSENTDSSQQAVNIYDSCVTNQSLDSNANSGFVNKSETEFSPEELAILKKGPSYVPPPEKRSTSDKIHFSAEIQACYERMVYKDQETAASSHFFELLSGVNRINTQSYQEVRKKEHKQINTCINSIKQKNCVIMPSDKTKRLVCISENTYSQMLAGCLNEDDRVITQTLPSTRQQQFNKVIDDIAIKYDDISYRKAFISCKCSEPLPSHAYSLPKDHKPGNLKGRPIISTIHSSVRNLASWLAHILNPLVKQCVPAHLSSTYDFIECIKNTRLPESTNFGSLDVVNLYGSIPLEDSENEKGLISVVTQFWSEYKENSSFSKINEDDFASLLRLCLLHDCYLHDGKFKKQIAGVAMGNNAAPPFAIIFMHHIESIIKSNDHNSIFMWKRYIDDVFFVSSLSFQEILDLSNSISANIKFTLEKPRDDEISFLDVMVHRSGDSFQYKLYTKETHSNTCLPFDSFVPVNRKRSLVISETRRAVERSSNEQNRCESLNVIKNRFLRNNYPPQFIQKHTFTSQENTENIKHEPTTFLKVPFNSEKQKREINSLLRRTNLAEKIRLIYLTSSPLARSLRPSSENPSCPTNCLTCQTAEHSGCCFRKNVVYCIKCKICSKVYVGQTKRTARSRIKEDLTSPKEHVYLHSIEHNANSADIFKWKILKTVSSLSTRLSVEALFIDKNKDKLINGCNGKDLLTFLKS